MNAGYQHVALPWSSYFSLLSQGRLDSLGHRFRNGGGDLNGLTMFYVLVVLAITITVVWLVSRQMRLRESCGYHNHRSLFRELCRAHRMGWSDRRLLVLIARHQGVVVPARLFVEPERFEAGRLEGLKESQRRRITKLAATLFQANVDGGE